MKLRLKPTDIMFKYGDKVRYNNSGHVGTIIEGIFLHNHNQPSYTIKWDSPIGTISSRFGYPQSGLMLLIEANTILKEML